MSFLLRRRTSFLDSAKGILVQIGLNAQAPCFIASERADDAADRLAIEVMSGLPLACVICKTVPEQSSLDWLPGLCIRFPQPVMSAT